MRGTIISEGVIGRTVTVEGRAEVKKAPTVTVEFPAGELPEGIELLGLVVELRVIDAGRCEHGVAEGDWCELCKLERDIARFVQGDMDDKETKDFVARVVRPEKNDRRARAEWAERSQAVREDLMLKDVTRITVPGRRIARRRDE